MIERLSHATISSRFRSRFLLTNRFTTVNYLHAKTTSCRWIHCNQLKELEHDQTSNLPLTNTAALHLLQPQRRSWLRPGARYFSTDSALALTHDGTTPKDPCNNAKLSTIEDFLGEPITFLDKPEDVEGCLRSYDSWLMTVITKGQFSSGGGNEEGIPVQSAHSSAMEWAELLLSIQKEASANNIAPMMCVVAIASLLAQTNVTYLSRVDLMLASTKDCTTLSLLKLAETSIAMKDNPILTPRERLHLQALHHLMHHERAQALSQYLHILQNFPMDALALSLALDLAHVLGDKEAALRAATTVFSYWQDRQSTLPGYTVVAALVAVGMAAGGRFGAAEGLIQSSCSPNFVDLEGCSGVAHWALALIYDAEGRIAEGISFLHGYDGVRNYEKAGFLFFDSRLSGYGGRFALDRERKGLAHKIQRVYDNAFDRVILYSGFSTGTSQSRAVRRAPMSRSRRIVTEGQASLFARFFGSSKGVSAANPTNVTEESHDDGPTMVDALTWLPPTPQLLTDATNLLLRLTMHDGSIDGTDFRWKNLRMAWKEWLSDKDAASFLPRGAAIAASLVLHDDSMFEKCPATTGAALIGRLLQVAESGPTIPTSASDWKEAVRLLSSAMNDPNYQSSWDIDARPLFEVAVCYAACRTDHDMEILSVARSICSRGVALRPNSPEEWNRYSSVLTAMGDDVAAEEALSASISMGAGEGGSGSH